MAYLSSENVKVFPSAYRGTNESGKVYDPESKLNSEKNFARRITSLTGEGRVGYVISREGNKMTFCIQGYIFDVDFTGSEDIHLDGDLFASIKLGNKNTDPQEPFDYGARSLLPYGSGGGEKLDSESGDTFIFIGVDFTASKPGVEPDKFTLQLLENGEVPEASKLKFEKDFIEDQDGKSINTQLHSGTIYTGKAEMTDGMFAVKNESGQYIYWVDHKGNIINAMNNPQESVVEIPNMTNAIITYNKLSNKWEADYADVRTGRRYYKNAGSLNGDYLDGQSYNKVQIGYEPGIGVLSINFDDSKLINFDSAYEGMRITCTTAQDLSSMLGGTWSLLESGGLYQYECESGVSEPGTHFSFRGMIVSSSKPLSSAVSGETTISGYEGTWEVLQHNIIESGSQAVAFQYIRTDDPEGVVWCPAEKNYTFTGMFLVVGNNNTDPRAIFGGSWIELQREEIEGDRSLIQYIKVAN